MKLIGTCHLDLEGPRRLKTLLDRLKPNSISIEAPHNMEVQELIDMFCKEGIKLKKQVVDSNLPDNLKQYFFEWVSCRGYELIIPVEYSRDNGATIYLVDHPNVLDQQKLSTSHNLILSDTISPNLW